MCNDALRKKNVRALKWNLTWIFLIWEVNHQSVVHYTYLTGSGPNITLVLSIFYGRICTKKFTRYRLSSFLHNRYLENTQHSMLLPIKESLIWKPLYTRTSNACKEPVFLIWLFKDFWLEQVFLSVFTYTIGSIKMIYKL